MNLIEESFQNKQENKKKTAVRIVLVAIILLVISIIGISAYLIYNETTDLKLFLNGQTNNELEKILVIEEDGTIYAPIKDIAKYFGYESYNGEYKEKSEETNKCYIKNESEVANFALGSEKIYKLDLTNKTENYEYLYAKNPVKAINGKLYATSEMLEKAFNISFKYDQNKNRITILTMPYLIQVYSNRILDYGYNQISDVFANQKTVLQDMLVVLKGETNPQYGVIDVQGNVILEAKYDNITYLPNIGDFLVQTNGKVGIMSKTSSNTVQTKIQIMYDSIELMDSDIGLYVVKRDNKVGVLDLNGNTKIYIENDEVGMEISNFTANNIKSKYLLVGNLIPVRKGKLWGLYDKNGNQVVDFKYDSFGYVATTNKDALNLLVIPDYDVLVACKDKKYTLLNSVGKELFAAPIADDIYMTINEGKRHYYIMVNNSVMDAEVYLDNIGIKPKSSSSDSISGESSTSLDTNSTNSSANNTNSTVTNNTTSVNENNVTIQEHQENEQTNEWKENSQENNNE